MERPSLYASEQWSGQQLLFVQTAIFSKILECKQLTLI